MLTTELHQSLLSAKKAQNPPVQYDIHITCYKLSTSVYN